MDDSCQESKHHVVCAAIIEDQSFKTAEGYLGFLVEEHVPEDLRADFEFHAADLYAGNPPFQKIGREKALQILSNCASIVEVDKTVTLIYGAVHTGKLRASIHATATPADVAFRLCIPEIEKWLVDNAPNDMGIIIADDTSNQSHKKHIQASFRAHRSRCRVTYSRSEDGALKDIQEHRGKLSHIHDDMYFGNSGQSIGIQLADIYCWIILRHLEGKEDTEFLYKKIEQAIVSSKIEPSS